MFYWFIKIFLYIPFWILFPYVIKGEKFPKGKCIYLGNHRSIVDPVMFVFAFRRTQHCLSKKELFKNWFMRRLWLGMKAIPIDRKKVDISTVKTCLKLLKEDKVLTIFPEGTRNKTDAPLLELKEGAGVFAIKSGAPLVPIWLSRKPTLFRLTKIYVGEPFYLTKEDMQNSTEIIKQKMLECREKALYKKKKQK